jgi:hypothetical protein
MVTHSTNRSLIDSSKNWPTIQFSLWEPFQSSHNPNSYTRNLSNQSTIPIHTPGAMPTYLAQTLDSKTLTIINRILLQAPFQTIHNPLLYTRYLSTPSTIRFHSRVSTTTQTVLRAPFQTIHIPIPYTRYLSKLSTFPIHTPGTNPSLFHTPGTFPIQPPSQSVHEVPCQSIHIPNPYVEY